MKVVHKPVRECICCGKKLPKEEMLRIVKNETGIFGDITSKSAGRGAYVCKSPECREKLEKQKRLDRAFKQRVDEQVYREVVALLERLSTETAEDR